MKGPKYMKNRKKAIISVSVAAAIAVGGGVLALAATAGAQASGRVQAVSSTITFDLPGETLAPPPADASPALTADAALVKALNLPDGTAIPANTTVLLGLYTLPVGPADSCGSGCQGDTVVNGTAYQYYNVLAYGFEQSRCPDGSLADGCQYWEFVDANTGEDLGGIVPRFPASTASPSPSPTG